MNIEVSKKALEKILNAVEKMNVLDSTDAESMVALKKLCERPDEVLKMRLENDYTLAVMWSEEDIELNLEGMDLLPEEEELLRSYSNHGCFADKVNIDWDDVEEACCVAGNEFIEHQIRAALHREMSICPESFY